MHSRSDARLRNQEQNQLIQIDTVAVAGFHAEEPQNCFTTGKDRLRKFQFERKNSKL